MNKLYPDEREKKKTLINTINKERVSQWMTQKHKAS